MLDHWFYAHGRIDDTPIYQSYGTRCATDGFPTATSRSSTRPAHCPPSSPRLFLGDEYGECFGWLMAACGVVLHGARLDLRSGAGRAVGAAVPRRSRRSSSVARADPVRLLAGRVRRRRARRLPPRPAPPRLGRARGGRRDQVLPRACWCRSPSSGRLRRRGRAEPLRGLACAPPSSRPCSSPSLVTRRPGLWDSFWGQLSRPLQIETPRAPRS